MRPIKPYFWLLLLMPWGAVAAAESEVDAEAEAEATTTIREVDPAIFDLALDDFYARRYPEAAAGFWGYIHYGDASLENYEWAQYFLAESLRNLGLWHAAVQYYYIVAKTRSHPEILPEALSKLEVISRRRPFSEALIYEDLIYDSDFGSLPPHLSDWVHYVQGLYDYRNGFLRWGETHFDSISKDSPYLLRANYVRAVHYLRKKQDERAADMLGQVTDSPIDEPDVKNKAYIALARLFYDMGQYREALASYDKVKQINLSYEQAQILLEKAWAAFQLKEYRKALGYLHALEAPSYQDYFVADAFVLRGIVLKELCHYIPAKRAVRSFRFRYQRTLDQLHRRLPMAKIHPILVGATQEGPIARRTLFMKTLEEERKLIDKYDSQWEDVELDAHLRKLYDSELAEQNRRWRMEFDETADKISVALLQTERQVNLLDYELGLDIFKRLKKAAVKNTLEESLAVPFDSASVYYEFDSEYWNDELHSYQFFVSNRCIESAEGQ